MEPRCFHHAIRAMRVCHVRTESIVAYLRTLEPVQHTVPGRRLPFPLPLIVRTMPKAAELRPIPAHTDKVAYGEHAQRGGLR